MADNPAPPPSVLRFPPRLDVSGLREAFPDATILTGKAASRRADAALTDAFHTQVDRLDALVTQIRETHGGDNLVTEFAYTAAQSTARTGDFRVLAAAVAAVEAWLGGDRTAPATADADE